MPSQRSLHMHFAIAALAAVIGSASPTAGWAQAAGAASPERIRAQALRMKEYRDLLNDRDASVRMAALGEMINSSDPALRELAFDAAFSSADQAMRALALRAKLVVAQTLVVEVENTANVPEAKFTKIVEAIGSRHAFRIEKVDPQTGALSGAYDNWGFTASVSGQELSVRFLTGSARLRLGDGGVMLGNMTKSGVSAPIRLTLQ